MGRRYQLFLRIWLPGLAAGAARALPQRCPSAETATKNAAFAAFRGRVARLTGGQTSYDRRRSGRKPSPAAVGWLRLLQPRCATPPIRVHDDDKAHRKQSGYPFGPPFYLVPQITWRGRKRCITKRKRLKS